MPFLGSLTTGNPVAVIGPDGDIYLTGSVQPGSLRTTAGAAQREAGGGMCSLPAFPVGSIPQPCPAAFVMRIGSSGSSVIFSTYLGGRTSDAGTSIAVDAAGYVYVVGTTNGDFPVTSGAAASTDEPSARVFVVKLAPDGEIVYATYVPDATGSAAITADAQGAAYVTGTTPANHAFVCKISADGSQFLYRSTFAGSQWERGLAITLDDSDDAIVAGSTSSPDLPAVAEAVQNRLSGDVNAFVAKFDRLGGLVAATYLGGSASDAAAALSVDPDGNILVVGVAASTDFPTTAESWMPTPLVPMWASSPGGFAAKLSPNLDRLLFSTYVYSDSGGARVIAPATDGGALIAGSSGAGFPVTDDAPQPCFAGSRSSAFLARLGPNGELLQATYAGEENWPVSAGQIGRDGALTTVTSRLELTTATFGTAVAPCVSSTLLNAATFAGAPPDQAPRGVSPGELISLTGIGMGPDSGAVGAVDRSGARPLELGGVRVLFDGVPAPLLYAQSRQINTIVPIELGAKTDVETTVIYEGVVIASTRVALGQADPQLFRLHAGFSTQAAALNEDGSVNGPENPAEPGSIVQLFGTGFGAMSASVPTGALNPSYPSSTNIPATATIGGVASEVLYAAAAPGQLGGVVQVNVRIPSDAPDGDLPVSIAVKEAAGDNTIAGSALATVAVRR